MSKIRIYELAKKIGVSTKIILSELSKLGIEGKTHTSSIETEVAQKIEDTFRKKDVKPSKKLAPQKDIAAEKTVKPSIEKLPEEKVKPAKPEIEEEPEIMPETEKHEEPLPPEEEELKIPDRFKKEIETEKIEKFKTKPGMQRAFQTIRKIEPKRWYEQKPFRKAGRVRVFQKEERKPQIQHVVSRKKTLKLPEGTTVKEFSELIGIKLSDVIKKFMELGYMLTINQPVDNDAALLVAEGFGIKLELYPIEEDTIVIEAPEDVSKLLPRPPVITIMGHVDHGKTSLLDAIRETKVTETEAGGITQHIGAYKVNLEGKDIVFLDTPGHEAFTSMRARGAKVTDIVVLVVAADDGVMPQTVEAINHANAASVPIVIAINKIDKSEANLSKVRNELAELGIISEEWGGQNIFVEVSAKKRIGIEHLLEMILLQAEVMELKANPDKKARGTIIEAKLDRGRGPVATVLVRSGTLSISDAFLAGTHAGKVRALIDDTGKRITEAGPSTPVEVIGFQEVPLAGDVFTVVEDEKRARQIALARQQKMKLAEMAKTRKLTLDELYAKIKEGAIRELNIIIKGDVQGSVEAIKEALESITHPQVKVKVIHSSAGGITESDVMLASASSAIIIGFNIRPEPNASQAAEKEGVDIRLYNVIYEAIDDVKKALEGLLEPTLKEKTLGRAEVRQLFPISRVGTIAGCYVLDGSIIRLSDGIRVIRDSIVVYDGKIASLKRFKEDIREAQAGYECGIMIENFNDIKVGDILENYIVEKIAAKL
ncbi:MAG: translation initiation factor IF-2 [Nitrospirae bacterium CG_4_10_14_0_8_um_filter_41_23]|nr:translation initiation factor IF-2 [Nitrospirota bacterium]PIQ93666.1 MAG: translation initiation factor IF-2 [Nitrospirae bacterium CG11_big_fil_rev_8_21_14_0_20_41_14]PIV44355.1 MAG: translation initiation factor IF-2 [Nitrospirae bacterium CG02_land_8_20_14_3_00_41_53]PIW87389.1 MAG: translation initiation factor IF-2 [Nitrospirae bacterium CG_4_8_14_3_um_filter_41_47]PIY87041.1 MAG: translation initiation factor IF-2 [Nitrospirae bacterium CG_4_10_14_0_8_um_filter_41_23]PJA79529.1 MAG: 